MSNLLVRCALVLMIMAVSCKAAEWTKFPTWRVDGTRDAVIETFTVLNNGWAIRDSTGMYARSNDQGLTWQPLKPPTGFTYMRIYGPAVFASIGGILPDTMCVYDFSRNLWIPAKLPLFQSASNSWSSSGGWGRNYKMGASSKDSIWLYQSMDSGLTWKSTVSISIKDLPFPMESIYDIDFSNNTFWYRSSDKKKFLLSTNGKEWDTLLPPIPAGLTLSRGLYDEFESTFTVTLKDSNWAPYLKITKDSGKTWIDKQYNSPGNPMRVLSLSNGDFISFTMNTDSNGVDYLEMNHSNSRSGPWTLLPPIDSLAEVGDVVDDKFYVARRDGIYALTLPTVGLQARTSLASTLRASVQAGDLVVSGAQPGAWELLDAQGRRALAGTTCEARFTIAAPGRGMWIVRVGQQRTLVMVP